VAEELMERIRTNSRAREEVIEVAEARPKK